MPRSARVVFDDTAYHVFNRGNDRLRIFHAPSDYDRFESLLFEARRSVDVRFHAYCLMPNHWHLVVRTVTGSDLARFVRHFAQKHAQWMRVRQSSVGEGHVYQGRFDAVRIDGDEHFLTACRYVERNPVEAGLVGRAEFWRWSSLSMRMRGADAGRLDAWSVPVPPDWVEVVNREDS